MANILISQLTAGTPAVTDLLIFANPTTGLAKKTTITTFNGALSLANLSDVDQVTAPQNSILAWDGSFSYVTDVLRGNGLTLNYIPYFASSNPLSLEDSRMINGTYGVEITETTMTIQATEVYSGAWRIQFANISGLSTSWQIAEIFSGGIYGMEVGYPDPPHFVYDLGTDSVLPNVVNDGGLLADGGPFTLTFICT